jgi:hypothetical protein
MFIFTSPLNACVCLISYWNCHLNNLDYNFYCCTVLFFNNVRILSPTNALFIRHICLINSALVGERILT